MSRSSVGFVVVVAIAGVAALLLVLTRPAGRGGNATPPDIILITADTLRADHLGCYGYDRDTSPNIDRFVRGSLLFERCLSHAPETRTSFASIFTGFLPHETLVFDNHPLPGEVDTLAEILQRAGYRTVAVVSNWVLRVEQGYEQGFEIYDDTMLERELVRRWPERVASNTTDRAIELLRGHGEGPLFLWVHYQDPHGPYAPPDRFAKMFETPAGRTRILRANPNLSGSGGIPEHHQLGENRDYYHYVSRYDAEIRYMDEQFGRLIEALESLGRYDDSLILFTSDHGEGMGERDFYFSHIGYLYGNLTHVPLAIRYGDELAGRTSDFVQQIDILPTVLSFLGLEVEPRLRGQDLLSGEAEPREIFAETRSWIDKDGDKFSVVVGGLKLIYNDLKRRYELFDLETDPLEERDLVHDAAYGERLAELKTTLERLRHEDLLELPEPGQPQKLTDEEQRKLRSLGYVN